MKKKYKALMIDVDGTMVDSKDLDDLPSLRVQKAVEQAKQKLHVGVITSRALLYTTKILDLLQLTGPCIVQGGAQIIDGESRKIISEHPLSRELLEKANQIGLKHGIKLIADNAYENIPIVEALRKNERYFGIISLPPITVEKAHALQSEFEMSLPELAMFTDVSIENRKKRVVFGTDALATKQHGILEVARILGIETHEIIAIGDGYNDFPMMMACGLKVAMGNAVPELKAIADYVAPTVHQDGVADVIEKFVL